MLSTIMIDTVLKIFEIFVAPLSRVFLFFRQ